MSLLYSRLQNYINSKAYPFHMPGHKGRLLTLDNFLQMDITEIPGFDNLHNANGVIMESQKMAAKTFGADESFFVVNGATGGIVAAILSVVKENDVVIVARNSHKSVYTGIILSGAAPYYVYPNVLQPYGIVGSISPSEIKLALEQNVHAAAVIVTSPTYEGVVSDIAQIAQITHDFNAILIVDEAHGAHFKFNQHFPKTALECGADIVIQSLHKTLPSLTQTAILHTKGERADVNKIQKMLAYTQSTSPSYLLMSSIDLCRSIIDTDGERLFDEYINNLFCFHNSITELKNISILAKKNNPDVLYNVDISKLTFIIEKGVLTGVNIEEILLKNFNIQIEMSGVNHFIALTSVADSVEAYSILADALFKIDNKIDTSIKPKYLNSIHLPMPVKKTSPRNAAFSVTKTVTLMEGIGEVSADFIIPYPPGVPIIVPGEMITKEILELLTTLKQNSISLIGITDNKIIISQ